MILDITKNSKAYLEFYEKVGKYYPETLLIHNNQSNKTSRFQTVLRELKPFAQKKKMLLDVGCNDGVYTIPYVKLGAYACGLDISESLIIKARKRAKMNLSNIHDISFEIGDIQTELEIYSTYDVILMSEVIEHVNNPKKAIQNAYHLLKQDGHFILTCPTPLHEIFKKIDKTKKFHEYFQNMLSYKLYEMNVINSNDNNLSNYGIKDYLYRHDGYYPLGLKFFIESFGFKCKKLYTIGFRIPLEFFELFVRRIPFLNLFGITNVQIFVKE